MPWTIDHKTPSADLRFDALASSIGKALILANLFESKCSSLLAFGRMASKATATHPDSPSRDDWIECWKSGMLGACLRELGTHSDMPRHDLSTLDAARRARNWIAHEGGLLTSNVMGDWDRAEEHLIRLRVHVTALAHGDNIVSGWLYQVEAKESAPDTWMDQYVERVLAWTFGKTTGTDQAKRC